MPIGRKDDQGKLDWSLLPLAPIREIIKVLMFGKTKYKRDNWQQVDNHRDRYYSAAIRHLTDWYEGRKKDKETKLYSLAHAGCCIIFLLWFDINKRKR